MEDLDAKLRSEKPLIRVGPQMFVIVDEALADLIEQAYCQSTMDVPGDILPVLLQHPFFRRFVIGQLVSDRWT